MSIDLNPDNIGFVQIIGGGSGSTTFGTFFSSSDGSISAINNNGGYYQFDKETGARALISASPGSGNNDGASCFMVLNSFEADLSITKNDNVDFYVPGEQIVYTIQVSNTGPFGVQGANVLDNVPMGIPIENVTYFVQSKSNGVLSTVVGTQSGNLNDIVTLPLNTNIVYKVIIQIPNNFSDFLVNTAQVIAQYAFLH